MARTARSGGSDDARDGREAIIGRTTRVRGRVSGDGNLLIEGNVEGDIAVRGDLTIAEGGRATSSIEADAVTLRGELDGDVRARGLVRIEAGARVRGDVQGESFALEEGAEFVGRLDAAFELPAELGGTTGGRRR
ncbi:MAG TPA: polymer-forming cytoskeletal protein [Labilithrix sp.]|jgi:cytoskeletal protein CcmA (bactofilin family)|nr:polymer-forming cytoskeletal protein [Labilithrix sp.]